MAYRIDIVENCFTTAFSCGAQVCAGSDRSNIFDYLATCALQVCTMTEIIIGPTLCAICFARIWASSDYRALNVDVVEVDNVISCVGNPCQFCCSAFDMAGKCSCVKDSLCA